MKINNKINNKPKELNPNCKIGDLIKWTNGKGIVCYGTLLEWEDITAIIKSNDGSIITLTWYYE